MIVLPRAQHRSLLILLQAIQRTILREQHRFAIDIGSDERGVEFVLRVLAVQDAAAGGQAARRIDLQRPDGAVAPVGEYKRTVESWEFLTAIEQATYDADAFTAHAGVGMHRIGGGGVRQR